MCFHKHMNADIAKKLRHNYVIFYRAWKDNCQSMKYKIKGLVIAQGTQVGACEV